MATTSMDYEAANGDRYDGSFYLDTNRRSQHDEALTDVRDTDEAPRYERDNRSASPRPARDDGDSGRRRSASPSGNGDRDRDRGAKDETGSRGGDDDGAINPGSNLFVTGIHPRLTEQEVTRMFEKYGDVEKCQIMRDPHTKESRGFGFVKMVTSDQADAAKEGLQGEQIEGRTLSIEKARRARPRTPTPGKYFGPPKRGNGGREDRGDRYARGGDDRRGGGAAGYERRERGGDDTYTGSGGRDGPRSRDPPAGGAAYADAPARSEGREPYGGWSS
ncbi:putative RNA-binding protein [Colletotrichum spaethianum]|uniref:RNA-binding protein n=1 Tax=Colletotrichum spaethianum TaxID=700344 RepID=A0AA37PAY8_9PEZI|nr:putative RNA-binding protein [Colletotrichum spaethianum]GKT48850.1 putative RNA-binding protein [Colletotrichum spaethianum]